ncbi:hypothetical protein MOTC310_09350 [Methylobacterium oryzae]|uniref:Uncharacterized protein n=2 Tax=Methylobacteriaceae TaxID=119045 RepID=A0ABU7TME6_9HYPH
MTMRELVEEHVFGRLSAQQRDAFREKHISPNRNAMLMHELQLSGAEEYLQSKVVWAGDGATAYSYPTAPDSCLVHNLRALAHSRYWRSSRDECQYEALLRMAFAPHKDWLASIDQYFEEATGVSTAFTESYDGYELMNCLWSVAKELRHYGAEVPSEPASIALYEAAGIEPIIAVIPSDGDTPPRAFASERARPVYEKHAAMMADEKRDAIRRRDVLRAEYPEELHLFDDYVRYPP